MPLKKRIYKRRAFRKKRAPYKKRPMVGAGVKKYVKATLHRQLENKAYCFYASRTVITSPLALTMLPVISQGVGSAQRIGNNARVVSSHMRCVINLLPYNSMLSSNPMPCWIIIWVVSQKQTNTGTWSGADFFQVNNSGTSFTSTALDCCLPFNKDNYTLHTKRFFKLGVGATSNNFSNSASGAFDNSPFAKYLDINLTKYYKLLRFNDTASNAPVNQNLWFIVTALPCNNANASLQQAEITYALDIQYEDA